MLTKFMCVSTLRWASTWAGLLRVVVLRRLSCSVKASHLSQDPELSVSDSTRPIPPTCMLTSFLNRFALNVIVCFLVRQSKNSIYP